MTVRIAVHGATGRMGRQVVRAVTETPGAELAAALEHEGSESLGEDAGVLAGIGPAGIEVASDVPAALESVDVVIDFSLPAGTEALLRACAERGVAAVVGTTGSGPEVEDAAGALVAKAPIVLAPNFSQGVTLLFHLAARAAELLGPAFDAEVIEMHHRRKVDAPSGTAVRLGEVVARAKGLDPDTAVIHGRSGQEGARPDAQVGVMALRGGDVVGEHTLVLAGAGERLELTHRATGREIFARGAVRAALWVVEQPPGRYDMADVMGIPR